MGQAQSGPGATPSNSDGEPKICYYELMGLSIDATDSEIKKAYRKRALELHPDRNFGDTAEATKKFADLQAAYEVLSDPHERAWYDTHRDSILRGDTDASGEPTTYRNVRLTSSEEIINLIRGFNNTVPFNDESTGFFGIARETFEHLALEEEAAAEAEGLDVPEYLPFGFSDDSYDTVVKPFYTSWVSFSTRKTFSWKDQYKLSDAPDRRTRRLMEKENNKLREDAIQEYNDAVRFLLSFVRKRDPRYVPNSQTDAERQQASRNAAAAQAARSRAANQQQTSTYEIPSWVQTSTTNTENDEFLESDAESYIEVVECVVCEKTFKSDKQLEAHERSKKHIKALQQLRRDMKRDGIDLELDPGPMVAETLPTDPDTAEKIEVSHVRLASSSSSDRQRDDDLSGQPSEQTTEPDSEVSEPSSPISDYAPRDTVINRLLQTTQPAKAGVDKGVTADISSGVETISLSDQNIQPKKGKAKAKRERKAAAQAQASQHLCAVCGDEFTSRTKLFTHIRETRHETPTAFPASTAQKGKRR